MESLKQSPIITKERSDEILTFLSANQWPPQRQDELVNLWNELKGDNVGLITRSHVRTPCRLKDVINSLRGFVKTITVD